MPMGSHSYMQILSMVGAVCCHDLAARCPGVSFSLQQRGLLWKSFIQKLPSPSVTCPQVLNCSQSSPESASKVLFWFLNVKELFSSTFPSSSSLQIYDLTYFLFQKYLSALISTVSSVRKQATCPVLVSTRNIFIQS